MTKEQILEKLSKSELAEALRDCPSLQGYAITRDTEYWLNKLGKSFRGLTLHTDFNKWKDRPKWQAKANIHVANFGRAISGDTPAEALQNLYIELKKANKI